MRELIVLEGLGLVEVVRGVAEACLASQCSGLCDRQYVSMCFQVWTYDRAVKAASVMRCVHQASPRREQGRAHTCYFLQVDADVIL